MPILNVLKKKINATTLKTNFEATDYLAGFNSSNPTQIKHYPQSAFASSIGLDVLKLFVQKTVGSIGADYTSLQDAFNAGYNVVKVITNISLTADVTHSNRVIYIDNGLTLTTSTYKFTGSYNRFIGVNGYRSETGRSLPVIHSAMIYNEGNYLFKDSNFQQIEFTFQNNDNYSGGRFYRCKLDNCYIAHVNNAHQIYGDGCNLYDCTIRSGGIYTYGLFGAGANVNMYNCFFSGSWSSISPTGSSGAVNLYNCKGDGTGLNCFSIGSLGEVRNFSGQINVWKGNAYNCSQLVRIGRHVASNPKYFDCSFSYFDIEYLLYDNTDYYMERCTFTLAANCLNVAKLTLKDCNITTGSYGFSHSNLTIEGGNVTGNLVITGNYYNLSRVSVTGKITATGNNGIIDNKTKANDILTINGNDNYINNSEFSLTIGAGTNTAAGNYNVVNQNIMTRAFTLSSGTDNVVTSNRFVAGFTDSGTTTRVANNR